MSINNKNIKNNGIFTFSLDFEMFWGVRDIYTTQSYQENLDGVQEVCNRMLGLFDKYKIHTTWATVGCMFATDADDLKKYLPSPLPRYDDANLAPYDYINNSKTLASNYHFANEIIEAIDNQENQELATHTFSHYYCMEDGQSKEDFDRDIKAAIKISKSKTPFKSIVLPRNQFVNDYDSVLTDNGIKSYRGTEDSWLYKARKYDDEALYRRGIRLADAYLNLSGSHCYKPESVFLSEGKPLNIKQSRYLRPFSNKLKVLEPLRKRRIKQSMKKAAKQGEIYHLWGHPHDFGNNVDQNMIFLEEILSYYTKLQHDYGMQSLNMAEISERVLQ